jgi:cytochrome c peroxidase
MKRIVLFAIIPCLIFNCTPEEKIQSPGSAAVQSNALKNFEYFTYNEYKPKFQVSSFNDPSKSSSNPEPGSPINSGSILMATNSKNPAPVDPVVNLGRVLFYDKNLSVNGQVSCGSCHIQRKAFTDGLAFAVGHNRAITEMGSMSIQNMSFLNNYQWQSTTDDLVQLVAKPLVHPIEMGNRSIEDVISRIRTLNYYEVLHKVAFGNAQIEEKSITWALAQFVGSIYSSNSKFDKSLKSAFADFTVEEKQGKELFFGKALCNQCHSFPTFAAPDFVGGTYGKTISTTTVNSKGIDTDRKGMANNGLSGLVGNLTRVKIPTLRNIEHTGPYMHDGRFITLEEVIEHYDHGVLANTDLDAVLKSKENSPIKLNLSQSEKQALKAFLLTLTDTEMLTARRYSDPFQ